MQEKYRKTNTGLNLIGRYSVLNKNSGQANKKKATKPDQDNPIFNRTLWLSNQKSQQSLQTEAPWLSDLSGPVQ